MLELLNRPHRNEIFQFVSIGSTQRHKRSREET